MALPARGWCVREEGHRGNTGGTAAEPARGWWVREGGHRGDTDSLACLVKVIVWNLWGINLNEIMFLYNFVLCLCSFI